MKLLFNECSIHKQFSDIPSFVTALESLMAMRQIAKRYNRELYCHRTCSQVEVTHQLTLHQAIQHIDKNKARALMSWFSKSGPYWDDTKHHSEDDYFECQDAVVTDTAIGECAHFLFSNRKAALVSLSPSKWTASPLEVSWHKDNQNPNSKFLINHTTTATLESTLDQTSPPLQSWADLQEICPVRFENLFFSNNAFSPLKGTPFVAAAANSIVDLLSVLSAFKDSHLNNEGRTEHGHNLYQQYFTGDNAWYTDSSGGEKRDFRNEMTFPHPEKNGEEFFAPFHGKVQTPQIRIHFNWPIQADTPLYILYVGPKITKR